MQESIAPPSLVQKPFKIQLRILSVDQPDVLRCDLPASIDEIGCRKGSDIVSRGYRVITHEDRIRNLVCRDEGIDARPGFIRTFEVFIQNIHRYSDDGEPASFVLLLKLDKPGYLCPASPAVGRPEVEEDDPAIVFRKIYGFTRFVAKHECRRAFAIGDRIQRRMNRLLRSHATDDQDARKNERNEDAHSRNAVNWLRCVVSFRKN